MWAVPWVGAIIAQEGRLRNLGKCKGTAGGTRATGSIFAVRTWLCIPMLGMASICLFCEASGTRAMARYAPS
jgi:hypothetical protein